MLDIILIYSVDLEKQPPIVEVARDLGERLGYYEWEAIFYFELMGSCPFVSRTAPDAGDTILFMDLLNRRFQEAIPDYPLLARMWDEFEDAFYAPEEIDNFRRECLRVRSETVNALAMKGLDTLSRCCDEASKDKLGIYMACD